MVDNFKLEIMHWIYQNGFIIVENVQIASEYTYNIDSHTINLGINRHENIGEWFEDFLVNLGCEYVDIPDYVLCFLHELGHSQTIYRFSDQDLKWYSLMKGFTHEVEDYRESVTEYWNVADELAANKWVVEFINKNIEQVISLWKIFDKSWKSICEDPAIKFVVNRLGDRL